MSRTVTLHAVVQRINVALRPKQRRLRRTRTRDVAALGTWHVMESFSLVHATHVDPEALARELGLLRGGEEIDAARTSTTSPDAA